MVCSSAATSTSITVATIEQPIERIKTWWFWSLSALCAGGICGLGLAVWASFSGKALLHQVGLQASYICSLGVILWRMAEVFHNRISNAMTGALLMLTLVEGLEGLRHSLHSNPGSSKKFEPWHVM